jgi:uncharacterized protein
VSAATLEVRHAPDANRYELWEGDSMIGVAEYRRRRDGVIIFPHTHIDRHRRDQGLGEFLVRGALEDVRARGEQILPACWFVGEFVQQNPEYEDVLASSR